MPLESYAGGLKFYFNTNEKSMSFEDPMKGSPWARKIKQVHDITGPPTGYISLIQIIRRYKAGDMTLGGSLWPGLLWL
jgi:hypothetical protein